MRVIFKGVPRIAVFRGKTRYSQKQSGSNPVVLRRHKLMGLPLQRSTGMAAQFGRRRRSAWLLRRRLVLAPQPAKPALIARIA